MAGNYTQTAGGTLNVQVGGAPASGLFGQINATAAATLAGTFNLGLVNGFLATNGQARALFESESAAGSRPVPIGAGGRSYGPSVTFWQGRYFVRLTAYQDVGDTLLDLAGAMVAGLR